MRCPLTTVLADADGTLLDTRELIERGQFVAACDVLRETGWIEDDLPSWLAYRKALRESVGGSTAETLAATLGRLLPPDRLAHVDIAIVDSRLSAVQDSLAPSTVRAYSGLRAFLQTIADYDLALAIVTSGTRYHVLRNFGLALPELGCSDSASNHAIPISQRLDTLGQRLKQTFGIREFCAVTADDVAQTKPNPEGMRLALNALGARADQALIIGDQPCDVHAGRGAGLSRVWALSHGFGTADQLAKVGADRVLPDLVTASAALKDVALGVHQTQSSVRPCSTSITR